MAELPKLALKILVVHKVKLTQVALINILICLGLEFMYWEDLSGISVANWPDLQSIGEGLVSQQWGLCI